MADSVGKSVMNGLGPFLRTGQKAAYPMLKCRPGKAFRQSTRRRTIFRQGHQLAFSAEWSGVSRLLTLY
jgi:hypothetical protein